MEHVDKLAQGLEYRNSDPKVPGSNPGGIYPRRDPARTNELFHCLLYKVPFLYNLQMMMNMHGQGSLGEVEVPPPVIPTIRKVKASYATGTTVMELDRIQGWYTM